VAGATGEGGLTGAVGDRGPQGRAGRVLTRGQVLATAFFVVLAFGTVSVRQELQQRALARTQHLLRQTQYDQCLLRNEGTARQNNLIDSGIAAERRKPVPDIKRIRDLTDFKVSLLNCGNPP
jgi:hypothetical protein